MARISICRREFHRPLAPRLVVRRHPHEACPSSNPRISSSQSLSYFDTRFIYAIDILHTEPYYRNSRFFIDIHPHHVRIDCFVESASCNLGHVYFDHPSFNVLLKGQDLALRPRPSPHLEDVSPVPFIEAHKSARIYPSGYWEKYLGRHVLLTAAHLACPPPTYANKSDHRGEIAALSNIQGSKVYIGMLPMSSFSFG